MARNQPGRNKNNKNNGNNIEGGKRLDGHPDRRLAQHHLPGITVTGQKDNRFEKRAVNLSNDLDPPSYPSKSKTRELHKEEYQDLKKKGVID